MSDWLSPWRRVPKAMAFYAAVALIGGIVLTYLNAK